MDAVRCYIGKSQNQWDKFLAQIAGAIRSTINRSTGFTPNKLMLGRELNQPADLIFPLPSSVRGETNEEYVVELTQALKVAHEAARKTLRATQKRLKKDYDVKVYQRQFEKGDRVYLLDTASVKGKTKKLSPPWKGPAVILEKLSPYHYRVLYRNTVFVANHDRLKKCTDKSQLAGKPVQGKEQYCFCKKPDDGSFMIQCDQCDEWFHGKCVRIAPEEGKLLDKYFCPFCSQGKH